MTMRVDETWTNDLALAVDDSGIWSRRDCIFADAGDE
jgi:hypothetical protein